MTYNIHRDFIQRLYLHYSYYPKLTWPVLSLIGTFQPNFFLTSAKCRHHEKQCSRNGFGCPKFRRFGWEKCMILPHDTLSLSWHPLSLSLSFSLSLFLPLSLSPQNTYSLSHTHAHFRHAKSVTLPSLYSATHLIEMLQHLKSSIRFWVIISNFLLICFIWS